MSNLKSTPPPAGSGRKPSSEPGPHQARPGDPPGKATPFPAAGTESEPGPHQAQPGSPPGKAAPFAAAGTKSEPGPHK